MPNDEIIKRIADMMQLQGYEDEALELEEAWALLKSKIKFAQSKLDMTRNER
jgi:hypothetical protein